jgi:two-component system, LytTR family, sensor kinase
MASHGASRQAGGPGRGSLAGLGAGDGPLPTAAGTDSDRDAADDRWIFWSSQVALFSLMTAGVTALVLTLGDGLFPPGTGGLGLIVVRMTGFAVLFGILSWVYTRPWFQRLSGWAFGAGVVGACTAMTFLDMAVFPPVIRGIMPGAEVIFERYPVPVTVNRFTFCLIWSTLFFVLRQRADVRAAGRQAEAARLEATSALLALRTSELERLSQQIEPHFLFNALSAVLACRHDPDGVEAVTTALGDYLRFSLARGAEPEPLGQELDAIEQLLSIHEARFRESLSCSVAASLAARRQLVPPLVLAPLLDNALKYGGQTSPLPRRVAVEAALETDRLVITVANSGRWIEPGATPGTGLANLRRRLELLGIRYQLDFHEADGLVTARLVLPAQVAAGTQPGCEAATAATASTVHVELVDIAAPTEEQDG